VSFRIKTHEDEFISTVKAAIKSGDIIRTQITPDNLKQVFDKWVAMVGREIVGVSEEDYALLFFADIMHDGTVSTHANLPAELMHKNGDTAPVNFTPFEAAYQALTDKLRPQVFSLGFLRQVPHRHAVTSTQAWPALNADSMASRFSSNIFSVTARVWF
jgi:hypothetical protein